MCEFCAPEPWRVVSKIFENNDAALIIFQEHGVLPYSVKCSTCGKDAVLYNSRPIVFKLRLV